MGIFDIFKKKKETIDDNTNNTQSNEEKYGEAWLLIVGQSEKERGIKMMRELDEIGFTEATIALSMFAEDSVERNTLIKKAADAGNTEGLWQYCCSLFHAYVPNFDNPADAYWLKNCLKAAEMGCADAMMELGNVFHRKGNYPESMYWYAMSNAYDHPSGQYSMECLAKEWVTKMCPRVFNKSANFNETRYKCAISYLELNSEINLSTSPEDFIKLVLDGEPIAAYFAGDLFESLGNEKTAFEMYSVLAKKGDAHALRCCVDMMFTGRGTTKNVMGAIQNYKKAAEAGDRTAMFVTAEFLKSNNKNMAAYWYGVSHSRGYSYSLDRLVQLSR